MTQGYTPDGYQFTATYDGENRLSSIEYTDSGSTVHKTEYMYSGYGFLTLIKKYENGTPAGDIRLIRSGYLTIQERDASNQVVREYTWGKNMGGGIGGLLSMNQSGSLYTYLYDGRGNVSALLNTSQQVAAAYRYDAFGNLMAKTGSLDQPFGFSTKRYDAGTGLSYYGYRFYNPAIGKWLTRDPIGEAGGINLYGFVLNNPVNAVDPLGLLTTYYGLGATAYWGNKGSATASAGAILYSDKTGWFRGNYATYGAEKSPLGDIQTALGAGAGAGPVFGFMTGSADDFKGKASNLTFDLLLVGITYTTNGSKWGLSIGFGGKGIGLGYYMNETNTIITGEKLNNACK